MLRLSMIAPARIVATAACLVAVAAFAGACSSDLNPLKAAYQPGPAAPAFVAESRKPGGDFLPVGVSAPARSIRAKSAEGTKALEAELEGARGRNEAQGRSAESAGRATRPASATP
ncbi:hypothetical protein [Methylobacterium sp. Leaf100]|uniref:hypothetical protein n=1 Tax=Methylobacterium sp. Leaf100 TaxID=1736252 RepID=UPI0009EAFA6C|nr:hypothetical protein [Methylobacterium sp. Leaf100]